MATAERVVSVAGIGEVAIKHRIGKLPIAPDSFTDEMRNGGTIILPVTEAHTSAYARLPSGHNDPFDLLLVAVAASEKLRLVSADKNLLRYAATLPSVATIAV